MNTPRRRGVTRGYVAGLVGAAVIVGWALMLLAWSALTLFGDLEVVSTPDVNLAFSPLMVLFLLVILAWSLWSQGIVLLRGRQSPAWTHILLVSVGSYLLWCLLGVLVGMSIQDTWISPYAITLALAWALASIVFWALLARRVYTERPTPKWPWERKDDLGPDWANTDDDPWNDPDGGRP